MYLGWCSKEIGDEIANSFRQSLKELSTRELNFIIEQLTKNLITYAFSENTRELTLYENLEYYLEILENLSKKVIKCNNGESNYYISVIDRYSYYEHSNCKDITFSFTKEFYTSFINNIISFIDTDIIMLIINTQI